MTEPKIIEIPVGKSLAEIRELMVLATLKAFEGNRTRTARALGISRQTLLKYVTRFRERGIKLV